MSLLMSNTREVKPTPEAEGLYRRWMGHLNEQFTQHQTLDQRSQIVRDELYQMYFGHPQGRLNAGLTSEMGIAVVSESFDARNVTLPAEYVEGIDVEQFAP